LTDTQDSGGGGTTFAGQIIQNPVARAIEKANNGLVVPHRFFAYASTLCRLEKGSASFPTRPPRWMRFSAVGGPVGRR
jgi:hypothetical protein